MVRGPKVNYCQVNIRDIEVSSVVRPRENVHYEERNYSFFSSSSVKSDDRHDQCPVVRKGSLRLCVLSDSHGEHDTLGSLPPCDILIHAGDILMKSRKLTTAKALEKLRQFNDWFGSQSATYKIVVGGNHDIVLWNLTSPNDNETYAQHREFIQNGVFTKAIYLCNSSISLYNGALTVVGSPMSVGQGSNNHAFQDRMFQARTYAYCRALAADKTRVDILITHGPCEDIGRMIQPTLAHVYGHIHENYGIDKVFLRIDDESSGRLLDYRRAILSSLGKGMIKPDDDERSDTAVQELEAHHGVVRNQDRYIYWHRIAASIMDEDFDPKQVPIVMEFHLGIGS